MKGLESALGRINNLPARCRSALENVIRDATHETRDRAKGLAPVRTGALRASIRDHASDLEGRVETDCPYGAAVELGGLYTPAHPFLMPAARQSNYHERAKAALKEILL